MQTSLGRRGASRCLPSERILRNNISSASSKMTVMSVKFSIIMILNVDE